MLNEDRKKQDEEKDGQSCISPFKVENNVNPPVALPYLISANYDSSPLVSPPYRPWLSSLVKGGILNPWCSI